MHIFFMRSIDRYKKGLAFTGICTSREYFTIVFMCPLNWQKIDILMVMILVKPALMCNDDLVGTCSLFQDF